jgi:ATP-dependent RNA helicase DeaD
VGDEEREGAARSQNVVLQGPADARTMAAAMRPGVERSREVTESGAPACLVITPTVEQALSAAEQARVLLADDTSRVVPVSQVARARRVLGSGAVSVVTGTAADLLQLRKDSGMRIDGLRAVVIIGLDDILAEGDAEALQALLGDIPSEAMRVVTLDVESAQTDTFIEAQLFRARRMLPPPVGDGPLAVKPAFVITSVAGRADALRMVLDALDPPSVVIVTGSDASEQAAQHALVRLGLVVDGLLVQVVRQPTSQHVALVVLWDAPVSSEALTEALATKPVDVVALLSPEELPSFRRFTLGEASTWVAPTRRMAINSRIQRVRTALREALQHGGGASASELALLTPLLDEHDAVEIAAAALRLYEKALQDAAAARIAAIEAARPMATASAGDARSGARGLSVVQGGGKQRVFLAVGKRDMVRVGDIVGAVANEAGIDGRSHWCG